VLILKRPWTEQPQDAVNIDWDNPITKGLTFLYFGDQDLTTQKLATNGSGVSRRGTTRTFTGSNGAVLGGFPASITASDAWSQLAVVRPSTLTTRNAPSSTDGANATIGMAMGYTTSSAAFIYPKGDTAAFTAETASGFWESGKWIVAGASYIFLVGASRAKVYKNGALFGTPAITNEAVVNASGNLRVGAADGTNFKGWVGDVGLVAFWSRELAETEQRSLGDNPWQLFEPRRIPIPYAAAAGNWPNILSVPTYVPGSLTSTGFRPRVTATY
jgi:hypothetical protein